jgi:molybdenum ABC transporter molybdate-binding protein
MIIKIVEAWHADSLAGPMQEMKRAFEVKHTDVRVNLTSGRSKELADRLLSGDACDVFAPSDPAVIQYLFGKKVGGRDAASWYVVFSANELVVITRKGNPLGLKRMIDLGRDSVTLARVAGEKDMATHRTIEFIRRAAAAEGRLDSAQTIIDGAAKEHTIPEVVKAVCDCKTDAGIVYLSAAVTAADDVEMISFSANLNLSEEIRNVVTIPGAAKNGETAEDFIKLMLSAEGRLILRKTGQPPIVPPIKEGKVPFEIPIE